MPDRFYLQDLSSYFKQYAGVVLDIYQINGFIWLDISTVFLSLMTHMIS